MDSPMFRLVESNSLETYSDWGNFLDAVNDAFRAGRTVTVKGSLYHDLAAFLNDYDGSQSLVARVLKAQGVDGLNR